MTKASRRHALPAVAVIVALATGSRAARSDGNDHVEDARKHFLEGVQRFEQGDFEAARRLFVAADGEHHAPSITYNLARAEERLSHVQAAVDAYERYLGEAGSAGEYVQSAAIAVAELRARAARARIESVPEGARVFVDGGPLPDPTPLSRLLSPGTHHVAVEGDGWRSAADVEAVAGQELRVTLRRPAGADDVPPTPPRPSAAAPSPAATAPEAATDRASGATYGPSGFVAGGTFLVAPTVFFGATQGGTNGTSPGGGQPGIALEVGYAFSPRAEILAHGIGTLGSTCTPFGDAHIVAGGPAIAYRVIDPLWIGASVLGGNAITCRGALRYDTGLVLAPSVDLAFAVAKTSYGQWLVSASASYFVADHVTHSPLLYFPLGFGLRLF